jgi:hypothetical protein
MRALQDEIQSANFCGAKVIVMFLRNEKALWVRIMMFNATIKNSLVISWLSFLLVENTENHRPAVHHCRFDYILKRFLGPSWSSLYGSWTYNYLCHQYLSPLTF